MVGMHHVIVESPRLKYEFNIRRNLTIIQGDSATGKTTLIELLRDFSRNGNNGVIKISSDKPCVVFDGNDNNWKEYLSLFRDSLVFIDEGHAFIRTKEFADRIRNTDNYYILITRDSLPCLPYSIHEIYGIRTSGKYHFPEQIYHEFYPIYGDQSAKKTENVKQNILFITEDSKSGFQFLQKCCFTAAECISAKGNAGIFSVVKKLSSTATVIIVADGAAFGAFMEKLLNMALRRENVMLFLPESFEWLILRSGIIEFSGLDDILEKPYDYIESARYFSWERYFTALLEKVTAKDKVKEYHKDALAAFYTEGKNRDRILAIFPGEIRSAITQNQYTHKKEQESSNRE